MLVPSLRKLLIAWIWLLGLMATPLAQAQFVDDFSRPDSAALGNGWLEKSQAAFDLVGGQVTKQAVGSGYRDNIVYRPAGKTP